ncbi:MAG: nuclear transport factor 2 family protein [Solirubrobacterales bacterium]
MSDREQLIRRGYDAWNRGDFETMEKLLDREFEIDATDRVLNPDRYVGLAGFRRLASEMFEIWDSWLIEPDEFVEHGDLVFVTHRIRARGKGSGLELEQTYWSVWTVRDGRAVKLALYVDHDRARAAAGLSG